MMISLKRVERLLAPSGFVSGWGSTTSKQYSFQRITFHPELREGVWIHCAGTHGESAAAYVRVSVMRCIPPIKGLLEQQLLLELANDPLRGSARFTTREEVENWERRLSEVAPVRAASLSRESGNNLLERTSAARAASLRYVALLNRKRAATRQDGHLIPEATTEQVEEASRIAGRPGVMQVVGAEEQYMEASLALLAFGEEVEGAQRPFFGKDPLKDNQMMFRIQLVADRLLESNGNKWAGTGAANNG